MTGAATPHASFAPLAELLDAEHPLSYREEQILRLRFGLGLSGDYHTYDEIGCVFGVTLERIRAQERTALAKVGLSHLRSPAPRRMNAEQRDSRPPIELPPNPSPDTTPRRSIPYGHSAHHDLLIRDDIELKFVQHRVSGLVHVLVPADPDAKHAEPIKGDAVIDIAVGACNTLCGYVARRHLGGFELGDPIVGEFDRDQLCRNCYRAFGQATFRLFQSPDPSDTDEGTDDSSTESE